jgi:DNA invertase Pin-like site-specific DNA recombinase
MNVVLSARVSSEEQAKGESASIDQQLADMRALCERMGWNILETFVDCENYRATQAPNKGKIVNPSGERADRPGLLAMLEQLRTGEIDAAVCWRDDRLVRHPRVAVVLEDALDIGDARRNGKSKIKIFDATGGEIDRFTLSIKATIWREENKRRVERSKMGKIATLQQGRWPGHYIRLGYECIREPGKRGRRIVLADEQEVQIVKDIFDWYDSGVSVIRLRNRLLAREAQQKRQVERVHDWNPPTIYGILRSKEYTGTLTWRSADGDEYTIEIPQIIPLEQWRRVQAKLERNQRISTRNARGVYLLQGLLHCAECGRLTSTNAQDFSYHRLADGTYGKTLRQTPRHRYQCVNAIMFPEEEHPLPFSWSGRTVDWAVWRYIVDYGIKQPDLIRAQVASHIDALRAEGESINGEISHVRLKLAEIDQERAFYQRQGARGMISEAEFDARMEETEEARQHWREELDRLMELRDNADKVQSGLDYATQFLTALQAELPDIDQPLEELLAMPEDERNAILKTRQKIIRALCDKVEIWSDGRIKLYGVLDGSEAGQFELGRSWTRPWVAS